MNSGDFYGMKKSASKPGLTEQVFFMVLRQRLRCCQRWVIFIDDGMVPYHGAEVSNLADVELVIKKSIEGIK